MNTKKLKEKLKSVKNLELYIALALGVVVLAVIFFTSSTKTDKTAQDTVAFDEYISAMENKISSVIEKMDGVSNVKVAISYSSANEKVYAYETETKTNGEVVTETSTVVMVKGEPLVLKTLPPTISGVVIVAKGTDDAVSRLKIKQVVVTLLDVAIDNVQVFTYKS